MQTEQRVAGHKKGALAQRADGAFGQGREQRLQQIGEVVDTQSEAHPGEIVGAKPGREAVPMDGQAEQRQNQDGHLVTQLHLAASPALATTMPSSRRSEAPGAGGQMKLRDKMAVLVLALFC